MDFFFKISKNGENYLQYNFNVLYFVCKRYQKLFLGGEGKNEIRKI